MVVEQSERAFQESVGCHFGFLEKCGFRRVVEMDNVSHYFSKNISFEIAQDAELGEISIGLRSTVDDTAFLSLDDLCAWRKIKRPPMHAQTREYTERMIEWIATFLQKRCDGLIRGEADQWARVSAVSLRRSRDYTNELGIKDMRSRLPALWKAQEYDTVVKVMLPFKSQLTTAEAKRLAIAQEKIRNRK